MGCSAGTSLARSTNNLPPFHVVTACRGAIEASQSTSKWSLLTLWPSGSATPSSSDHCRWTISRLSRSQATSLGMVQGLLVPQRSAEHPDVADQKKAPHAEQSKSQPPRPPLGLDKTGQRHFLVV